MEPAAVGVHDEPANQDNNRESGRSAISNSARSSASASNSNGNSSNSGVNNSNNSNRILVEPCSSE